MVSLGDVLKIEQDEVLLKPDETYRTAGIYSFGRGVFERQPILGADTSYTTLFRLHKNQFILSRLNGWEGAVDVVSAELDGCLVSNEYPTFAINSDLAYPGYLRWITRWSRFWEQLIPRGSMVRRKRVKPGQLLEVEIPLPSMAEQRRVACRLNRSSKRIQVISHHSTAMRAAITPLLGGWLGTEIDRFDKCRELAEIAVVARGRGPRYEAETGLLAINQACVRWGRLDLARAREVEREWWTAVPQTSRIRAGDVLVNSTGEGTIGRVALATDAAYGIPFDSHILVVRCDESILLPEFLAVYLRSRDGQRQVNQAKGANTTKQTELGKTKLERFMVPVPSVNNQALLVSRFRKIQGRTRLIESRINEQAERLSAVVPAMLNEAFTELV